MKLVVWSDGLPGATYAIVRKQKLDNVPILVQADIHMLLSDGSVLCNHRFDTPANQLACYSTPLILYLMEEM